MHLVRFNQTDFTLCCSYLAPIPVPADGIVELNDDTYRVIYRELPGWFAYLNSSGVAIPAPEPPAEEAPMNEQLDSIVMLVSPTSNVDDSDSED